MLQQQDSRQHSQGNTEQVCSDVDLAREVSLLSCVFNLESKRTRNSAGQISRSNQLSGLKSKSSIVLSGVRTVSESSGSRCCPGRDASKASGDLQGKTSVNLLDGTNVNPGYSERIDNDQLLVPDLNAWNYVAKPDQAQSKDEPEQGFNYVAQAKKDGLTEGKACKNQRSNSNQVAGKRSLAHSQFNSLEGAK